jgi:drug/metabolite transporter (DMT)-like permease
MRTAHCGARSDVRVPRGIRDDHVLDLPQLASPGIHPALGATITLKASGAPVSLTKQSSLYFVNGGTSTAFVLLVGFMVLREPFTWMKLFAIGLIAIGAFLLQREGL